MGTDDEFDDPAPQDQGVPGRPQYRAVGFPPDPRAAASELAELQVELEVGEHPVAGSLLAAAKLGIDQWRDRQRRVEERWEAYRRALSDEATTRTHLSTLIRSLRQVAECNPDTWPSVADPPIESAGPDPIRAEKTPSLRISGAPKADAQIAGLEPGDADLVVLALGEFRFYCRGHLIDDWHGTKSGLFIRLLSTQPLRLLSREAVIDELWPEIDIETGRRYLHQTVYSVRRTLQAAGGSRGDVVFSNDTYRMNRDLRIWVDAAEFEARVRAARHAETEGRSTDAIQGLESALALYRGDFLVDTPYEEWVMSEAERLRTMYLSSMNSLADLWIERGQVDAALELSQRVLQRHPCDELAHRRALRCHAAAGRQDLLARQYEMCVTSLRDNLGLDPTKETVDLYRSLGDR